MKKFLKCYPKLILFSYFTGAQTKDKILATQFKVVIQHWCCNARSCSTMHWWYSTVLAVNTKMVHLDFFGEGGFLITQTQKLMIASSSLKILAIRLVNHPLHPFPYLEPIISLLP